VPGEVKKLEYRKVQLTGRSSYIVTLPKDWVRDIGLEPGNQLAVKRQEDSSLMLIPGAALEEARKAEEKALSEVTLHATPKDNPQFVVRKMISLYVVGVDIIHIKSKGGGFAPEQKRLIHDAVRSKLLGAEIISESPEEIAVQILINHPEFPVQRAIRRMLSLALSMNEDVISALKTLDEGLARKVMDVDDDVDRLNLYVVRQLKYAIQNNQFKEIGLESPKEFLGYRLAASILENVADQAVKMAENVLTMEKPVDDEVYEKILALGSCGNKLFRDSMVAFFSRDYQAADDIISKTVGVADAERDVFKMILDRKIDAKEASSLRLILHSSRRMTEYSREMSEVTLNRTIEETCARDERRH